MDRIENRVEPRCSALWRIYSHIPPTQSISCLLSRLQNKPPLVGRGKDEVFWFPMKRGSLSFRRRRRVLWSPFATSRLCSSLFYRRVVQFASTCSFRRNKIESLSLDWGPRGLFSVVDVPCNEPALGERFTSRMDLWHLPSALWVHWNCASQIFEAATKLGDRFSVLSSVSVCVWTANVVLLRFFVARKEHTHTRSALKIR